VRAVRERFDLLTPREHEVLELVLAGKLNKQIALQLDIHERTVKLHRTSITTKLGVHSAAEMMRMAHEAGMFQPQIEQTPWMRRKSPTLAGPARK
jgi:DNA-binding NarL/FixJ family response regulator